MNFLTIGGRCSPSIVLLQSHLHLSIPRTRVGQSLTSAGVNGLSEGSLIVPHCQRNGNCGQIELKRKMRRAEKRSKQNQGPLVRNGLFGDLQLAS